MTLALIEIDLMRIRVLAAKADEKLLLYLVEMALVEVRKAAKEIRQ